MIAAAIKPRPITIKAMIPIPPVDGNVPPLELLAIGSAVALL